VERREKEVGGLRDEMREVNMGLEEEVRRVSADRDVWKGKAEKADQTHRTEITALEKQTRVSEALCALTGYLLGCAYPSTEPQRADLGSVITQ
jgi:hypothetical protein